MLLPDKLVSCQILSMARLDHIYLCALTQKQSSSVMCAMSVLQQNAMFEIHGASCLYAH